MKKFLILLACAAFPVMFPLPAFSQTETNLFKPGQSEMESQRQQDEKRRPATQAQSQPFDFNFGKEKEEDPVINQYSSTYKKNLSQGANGPREKLLPSFSYKFYFIHEDTAMPDEVTLRFITPIALSGCMYLKQPALKISQNPPVISLRVTEASIILDKSVRYTHFQCDLHSQFAQVDLKLNHNQLVKGGFKQIILSGNGNSKIFNLEVNGNEVMVAANDEIATYVFPMLPGLNE